MAHHSVYIRDVDEPIWERALAIAKDDEDSLSQALTSAARAYMNAHNPRPGRGRSRAC
jgi:hypothetical protein